MAVQHDQVGRMWPTGQLAAPPVSVEAARGDLMEMVGGNLNGIRPPACTCAFDHDAGQTNRPPRTIRARCDARPTPVPLSPGSLSYRAQGTPDTRVLVVQTDLTRRWLDENRTYYSDRRGAIVRAKNETCEQPAVAARRVG
jgi:hypothetical protein